MEFDAGVGVTNHYLYQDWLVLGVTDGSGNVLESYTHGADLSGGVGGGAGGIGGILGSVQAGDAIFCHYDSNGNIVQVSSSNQTQLAKYTYSPFGEVLLKEGAYDSRFQFSTKEYDELTALNYYGYRFYSFSLGRWLSRDPKGEYAGVNIYLYIANNPIGFLDYLGLEEVTISHWLTGDYAIVSYDIVQDTCDNGGGVYIENLQFVKTPDEMGIDITDVFQFLSWKVVGLMDLDSSVSSQTLSTDSEVCYLGAAMAEGHKVTKKVSIIVTTEITWAYVGDWIGYKETSEASGTISIEGECCCD